MHDKRGHRVRRLGAAAHLFEKRLRRGCSCRRDAKRPLLRQSSSSCLRSSHTAAMSQRSRHLPDLLRAIVSSVSARMVALQTAAAKPPFRHRVLQARHCLCRMRLSACHSSGTCQIGICFPSGRPTATPTVAWQSEVTGGAQATSSGTPGGPGATSASDAASASPTMEKVCTVQWGVLERRSNGW